MPKSNIIEDLEHNFELKMRCENCNDDLFETFECEDGLYFCHVCAEANDQRIKLLKAEEEFNN